MQNFQLGTTVYAKHNPLVALIIRSYVHQIYTCVNKIQPELPVVYYSGNELISSDDQLLVMTTAISE